MKYLKIINLIEFLFLIILEIGWTGLESPVYGNTYQKVWDSGNTIPNPVFDVAVGDLDNDGKPEIIVSDAPTSGVAKIYVFENDGDNSFQLVWDSDTMLTMRICWLAVGDQDGDGTLEIIALEDSDVTPVKGKLHVFENNGDNSYHEVWNSGITFDGLNVGALFLGDADNDAKQEIIFKTGTGVSHEIRIYENTENDKYQEVWNSGSILSDDIQRGTVGDADGDGNNEIIVGSGDIDSQVHVFENIGDDQYQLVWDSGNTFSSQVWSNIGDQDEDGKAEIIAGGEDGAVHVFENDGDNSYTDVWSSNNIGFIKQIITGDQDQDGSKEIIVPCFDGKVYLFENIGDNAYTEVWNSGNSMSDIINQVATGDQDGDGKLEIIAACYDGKIYIFEYPFLYDNLIENPGFENGLTGWYQTGSTPIYQTSTLAHSGNNSVMGIETSTGNLGRIYQDLTGKLVVGAQYKIGGWIKIENVQGNVSIGLHYVKSNGASTNVGRPAGIGKIGGTTDWQYFESNWFVLPEMPAVCTMLFFFFDFNSGTGTAWFDDVFLFGPSNEVPSAPQLLTPNSGSYINSPTPQLVWLVPQDMDGDSLHFKVEITRDSSFTNQISDSLFMSQVSTIGFNPIPPLPQGIGSCSYTLQDSLDDGTYYWRISAWDGNGYGEASPTYNFKIDTTPPGAPINLLANGANPSPWQQDNNEFFITWENPFDSSGIARYFYKLGEKPEHNYDTTNTVAANLELSPQLNIQAEQEFGDTLYVWLEDGAGNVDYKNNSLVELLYYNTETMPKAKILSPRPNEQLSQYIFIWSIFDFEIDSCALEYVINSHAPLPIEVPQDSFKGNKEFTYVWKTNEIGSVSLTITAWDYVGNSHDDDVQFELVHSDSAKPTAIIVDPRNNAFLHDSVRVTGYACGANFKSYSLFLSLKNEGIIIDTLKYDSTPKGGNEEEELGQINTKDYPDDEYNLILKAYNKNGNNHKDQSRRITIDNTLPTAEITAPDDDTLCCFHWSVEGAAKDSNFHSAVLKYWKSGESSVTILDTISKSGDFNKEWKTMYLSGENNLQLSVIDKGGLKAEDTCTYFITNSICDMKKGLKKRYLEFSLYIPPEKYYPSIICLEKIDGISDDSILVKPTGLICQIHSSIEEKIFKKPATFTIDYSEITLNKFDESKLSIFKYENDEWNLIGGTPDKDKKTITTSIDQIGRYGLFVNNQTVSIEAKELQINCQPRVFSPRGDGYAIKTAISFYLKNPTNVDIKIFNTSGRLVRTLVENELMNVGNNVVHWDGKDSYDNYCASGLYIVVIRIGNKVQNKTVMVLNN